MFAVRGNRLEPRPPTDLGFNFDANKQQRQLIAELENKNRYEDQVPDSIFGPWRGPLLPPKADEFWAKLCMSALNMVDIVANETAKQWRSKACPPPREILQEIQRLRLEHEQASQPTPEKAQQNPTLLAELRLLRQRKDELEQRMSALQESRRELMVQLEGLMKLLKEEEQKQAVS
ncbi:UNVERIFIED_CONTAM: hypothetical protein K2H54_032869 [Gekko kuhli]